jgi:hypothetical protein
VCITAEVTKHLRGTGHGWLAVDDPFAGQGLAELPAQGRGSGTDILGQIVEELSTEDSRQDAHGYQEVWSRRDPAIASGIETATGDDAVEMRVESEGLGPGVKDGDRAWRGSHALSTDIVERLHGRLEEKGVALSAVREQASMDRRGYGENDVEVGDGEEVLSLGLHPSRLV